MGSILHQWCHHIIKHYHHGDRRLLWNITSWMINNFYPLLLLRITCSWYCCDWLYNCRPSLFISFYLNFVFLSHHTKMGDKLNTKLWHFTCILISTFSILSTTTWRGKNIYSRTCAKRLSLGQRKSGLLRKVTS